MVYKASTESLLNQLIYCRAFDGGECDCIDCETENRMMGIGSYREQAAQDSFFNTAKGKSEDMKSYKLAKMMAMPLVRMFGLACIVSIYILAHVLWLPLIIVWPPISFILTGKILIKRIPQRDKNYRDYANAGFPYIFSKYDGVRFYHWLTGE